MYQIVIPIVLGIMATLSLLFYQIPLARDFSSEVDDYISLACTEEWKYKRGPELRKHVEKVSIKRIIIGMALSVPSLFITILALSIEELSALVVTVAVLTVFNFLVGAGGFGYAFIKQLAWSCGYQ